MELLRFCGDVENRCRGSRWSLIRRDRNPVSLRDTGSCSTRVGSSAGTEPVSKQGFVFHSSVDPDVWKHCSLFQNITVNLNVLRSLSLHPPHLTEVISCPDSLFPS